MGWSVPVGSGAGACIAWRASCDGAFPPGASRGDWFEHRDIDGHGHDHRHDYGVAAADRNRDYYGSYRYRHWNGHAFGCCGLHAQGASDQDSWPHSYRDAVEHGSPQLDVAV